MDVIVPDRARLIDRAEAVRRFHNGEPVSAAVIVDGAPLGTWELFTDKVSHNYGITSFDELRAFALNRARILHGDDARVAFFAPRSVTQRDHAPGLIFRGEEFALGGLSGVREPASWSRTTGDLPAEWREKLDSASRPLYVVFSYATPIAWVDADGAVTIPPVRYSLTTTGHQNLTARALGVPMPAIEISLMKGHNHSSPYRSSWQARKFG